MSSFLKLAKGLRRVAKEKAKTKENKFRQFNLYGVNVVVDGNLVSEEDEQKYVEYLREAYYILKEKGFEKVWKGDIVISPRKRGAGALYFYEDDWIQIRMAPSKRTTKLVIHELGHKFWYTEMTQKQRDRFESFVNVESNMKETLKVCKQKEKDLLENFKTMRNTLYEIREKWQTLTAANRQDMQRIVNDARLAEMSHYNIVRIENITKLFLQAAQELPDAPEVPEVAEASGDLIQRLKVLEQRASFAAFANKLEFPAKPPQMDTWVKRADVAIYQQYQMCRKFIDQIKKDFVGASERRFVSPVSTYGAKDISEAFAEAFLYYVTGRDMTRDQVDSFKSVLKEAETLQKEAAENEQKLKSYLSSSAYLVHFAFTNDRNKELQYSETPRNGSTPRGFYFYEADTLKNGKAIFANGRPYVFIVRPKEGLQLLDIAHISTEEAERKLAELVKLLDPGVPEKIERMVLKKIKSYELRPGVRQHPGRWLYYMVSKAHRVEDQEDPVRFDDSSTANPAYTTKLLQAIGYDGIRDITGSVYSSEPEQVCLFARNSFDIIDVLQNPQYDGRDLKIVT
jgi:hypothetical protein